MYKRRYASPFLKNFRFLIQGLDARFFGNFEPRNPKWHRPVMKQACLSYDHQANVADTSHSEIKANRVRTLATIRHCSTKKIDMQIYAQILVISLTRPAALATAQRVDGIHPSTPSPSSHLLSTNFFLFASFFFFLSTRIVSLYHSVYDAHFSSENTFFPSRRAPVER